MTGRLGPWLLLAAVLAGWEGACRALAIPALVLPPPSQVAQALWDGLASGRFWPHLRATGTALGLGLAAGAGLGLAGGIVLAELPRARALLLPWVVASQVVPKLALMPLLVLWCGFGLLPTVVVTALICFFPLLETTLTALARVPPERLELFRLLGASRWQTLWRLKLPAGLPAILAGLRIAVVLALVGVVVGEFIGTTTGLGALVIAAQGSMDTPLLFAALVLVTALGLAAYHATLALERRLLRPYS